MKRQPLVALKALRRLIADPERTDEVFVIMRALEGDAMVRMHDRFCASATGRSLQTSRPQLLDALNDRDRLARLPEGSLGRAYLAFVERHGITANGLVDASNETVDQYEDYNEQQAYIGLRLRDMHDLWHVMTGYETSPFGEVCVVAFSYAQTKDLGFAVIAAVGALKVAYERRSLAVLGAAWQAYRHGKRCKWFPDAPWEEMLSQPLEKLRAEYRIEVPTRYRAIIERWQAQELQPA